MKYRNKSKIEAISFDELVQYGRDNGGNIVNGMPWSFNYKGLPVTHENDKCYIVGIYYVKTCDMLVTFADGDIRPIEARYFFMDYEPVQEEVISNDTTRFIR